jgi:hypothetical protein
MKLNFFGRIYAIIDVISVKFLIQYADSGVNYAILTEITSIMV